jgi:hypothetical protein
VNNPGIDWNMVGTVATIGGIFIVPLLAMIWKFAKSVDRMGIAVSAINDSIKAQWTRIDEHGVKLDEHGNRLVKVETKLEYHEKGGKS